MGSLPGDTAGPAMRDAPRQEDTKSPVKKKPDANASGWEALLLSHIKAPAQGGKAGSGKPPKTEFNKGKTTYQATGAFF